MDAGCAERGVGACLSCTLELGVAVHEVSVTTKQAILQPVRQSSVSLPRHIGRGIRPQSTPFAMCMHACTRTHQPLLNTASTTDKVHRLHLPSTIAANCPCCHIGGSAPIPAGLVSVLALPIPDLVPPELRASLPLRCLEAARAAAGGGGGSTGHPPAQKEAATGEQRCRVFVDV